jgi:superfamily II DNA or RNA helicase
MRNPTLRHLVVSENGEPYSNEIVPLHWVGRPLPDRPDDVVFELTLPDGSAAPGDFLRLKGEPELGLFANSIYQLPVPLPGHVARNVVVPREVLTTVAAARRLRHCGAVIQGVDMPQFRLISMRPRFVCEISESRPAIPPVTQGIDLLMVEVQAVDPDGSLIQTRMGDGRWITKPDTKPATTVVQEIDRRQAESAVALLYEMNLSTNYESHKWWCSIKPRTFPETFVNWVKRLRSLNVEVVCSPELATLLQPPDKAQIELSVHNDDTGAGIDWFDVGVSIRAEDTTLTQDELKLLLKAQGQFVRLSGKGWRRLDVALTPEQEAQLAELGIESSALHEGEIRQRFHALQLADERIAGLLPEEHAARARERAGRLAAIAPPPVPSGLSAELRPYQLEGYHFLAHLTANNLGGILADDMGLGKTVQALTWLLHLSSQLAAHPARADRPLRALVVCPKSVVPNWTLEARRFTPKLLSAPLAGGALPEGANLVVVNYAQLRLAASVLNAVDWDAVILDEGQNIKNPQSLTARTARELRAANRIILTGTPIENRTLDLWSLFAFAMPGLLGTQASFRRTFNDKADPAAARARLARRVRHFMLRRTKSQVAADLPPRTEEDLAVELEGVQRQLYDAELKRTRAMLLGVTNARDFDKKRFNILQSLLRLRQICCDPRLVGLDKTALANDGKKKPAAKSRAKSSPEENDSGSAKLDALLDALEPLVEEGHRVLVFSQFVTMLEIIATELKSRGIGYLMLTGQTENRQELVDRFQSPEGESVFLLSLKAAGAGLNLTAASYVVLYDPWWNPAVEAQAIDRTHRIGQTEHVIAYRLIARNTIEEKIRKLQQSKADLARSIVQEETLATVMSLDDLRFVLSDDTGD